MSRPNSYEYVAERYKPFDYIEFTDGMMSRCEYGIIGSIKPSDGGNGAELRIVSLYDGKTVDLDTSHRNASLIPKKPIVLEDIVTNGERDQDCVTFEDICSCHALATESLPDDLSLDDIVNVPSGAVLSIALEADDDGETDDISLRGAFVDCCEDGSIVRLAVIDDDSEFPVIKSFMLDSAGVRCVSVRVERELDGDDADTVVAAVSFSQLSRQLSLIADAMDDVHDAMMSNTLCAPVESFGTSESVADSLAANASQQAFKRYADVYDMLERQSKMIVDAMRDIENDADALM